MKIKMLTLDNGSAGDISLNDIVFNAEIRSDLMARMVNWQLAKRRLGTHKVKERGEVAGSTRKFVRQKGSGGARHGNRKAVQFRGGGVVFGPVVRSHTVGLPKKVRAFALKSALSMKVSEGKLTILDNLNLDTAKTKELQDKLRKLAIKSAVIVGGETLNDNFMKASRNIPEIDALPRQGVNVYSILRREHLVLTQDAVTYLEKRLG